MSASHHRHEQEGGFAWLWMALLPLSAFLALAWGLVSFELPWRVVLPWVPSLDINLAFRIDGLSAQMLALITGIGTLVFVYAAGYLSHEPRRGRIFLVLPLFMLAMMGAVTADDVILLFVFWELTSVTSFLLVGFDHEEQSARDASRQALLVTMSGGLAMLGGLLLLAEIAGSWSLSYMIATAPGFVDDPRLPYAILLVLVGAFTKSAQFPFHFWLPNAMSAPTPVSAYLHSATMVKLGIYLMARLDTAFNDLFVWEVTLISVGTVTAIWGALLAFRERDLKRILARSTVSALGTLTLLVGLPSPYAGLAAVTFLVAHALYKAPLFMVAGNIDHATGTRIIDNLSGLRHRMPWSAAVAILAGLSMAGLPLAFGFVAKDVIGVAKADAELMSVIRHAFLLVNAIAAAVAAVAAIRVFWGPLKAPLRKVQEVPWTMLLPPLVIALYGIEFEFIPKFADPLLLAAAQSIAPDLGTVEISVTYALGQLVTATVITGGAGLVMFLAWDRLRKRLSRVYRLEDRLGAEAEYHAVLEGLKHVAAWHTRAVQPGRLDLYLRITLMALLTMAAFAWWQHDGRLVWGGGWPAHAWAWAVAAILIAAGAIAAALLRDRLAALMASGLVGYGAAVWFLFAGAPDLAFAQFMVETVLVVVAAAVLPQYSPAPNPRPVLRDPIRLALAIAAGAGTFVLLLQLDSFPENRQLTDWFGANSMPEAHGRNVVNVIIADFRALDTLGEIAVVSFSLLAALPLLAAASDKTAAQNASPLLDKAALPLYWLMLAVALWLVTRGHDEPGGGFIGGLVAAAGSSLLATLRGTHTARRFQFLSPLSLAMAGVSLAVGAGLIGLMAGTGFLRHPSPAGIPVVLFFDLGVLVAVWGALSGYVYSLLDDRTDTMQETA